MLSMTSANANTFGEAFVHTVGNEKFLVLWPSITAFGEPDFFIAERLAMGCGIVLFVRRSVADMAVQDNECRTALRLYKCAERSLDGSVVICVADTQNIPPVRQKSGYDVLGECQVCAALDRDVIVVVDPTEIVQF